MAHPLARAQVAVPKIRGGILSPVQGKVVLNKLQADCELTSNRSSSTSKNLLKSPNSPQSIPKPLSQSSLSSSTNFSSSSKIVLTSSFSTFSSNLVNAQISNLPSDQAANKKQVSKTDILSIEKYTQLRPGYYKLRRQIKDDRRFVIGPYSSVTFMNYDLVWLQIHEMLWIEKGGEKQIEEELNAYNPLIPQGNNLVFTFMLEYPDPKRRTAFLKKLGHVEDTIMLSFDEHKILAVSANNEIDRTTPDGKTSAVHFLKFEFTKKQAEDFKKAQTVAFEIGHTNYPHSTKLSSNILESLRKDIE